MTTRRRIETPPPVFGTGGGAGSFVAAAAPFPSIPLAAAATTTSSSGFDFGSLPPLASLDAATEFQSPFEQVTTASTAPAPRQPIFVGQTFQAPSATQQQHQQQAGPLPVAHSGGAADAGAAGGSLTSMFYRRVSVLITLMLLQSISQIVLEAFEPIVAAHIVLPMFLTMLVGAGGNTANQAAVRSITALATGELQVTPIRPTPWMLAIARVARRSFHRVCRWLRIEPCAVVSFVGGGSGDGHHHHLEKDHTQYNNPPRPHHHPYGPPVVGGSGSGTPIKGGAASTRQAVLQLIRRELTLGCMCAAALAVICCVRVASFELRRRGERDAVESESSAPVSAAPLSDRRRANGQLPRAPSIACEDGQCPVPEAVGAEPSVASQPLEDGASSLPTVDDDSDGDDADGNSAAVAVRPQQGLKKRQSLWGPVAAVTVSLVVIVAAAAPIGAVVPLLFARVGLDPEHAAPAVQVLMDVLGAVITCGTFSALLG